MHNPAIIYPVFALVCLTFVVLLQIPFHRVRAVRRREIRTDAFKYGESSSVPGYVSIPNRNYMNLLELPILFYVACLLLYFSGGASVLAVWLAWTYVGLRIVHSIIHLSYNNVMHRLAAFALSNFVLLTLWIVAGMHFVTA